MKVHVFVTTSFFLSQKLMFLLKILKNLLNVHYKGEINGKLSSGKLFLSDFQWLQHDICQCWWLQQLNFAKAKTKTSVF